MQILGWVPEVLMSIHIIASIVGILGPQHDMLYIIMMHACITYCSNSIRVSCSYSGVQHSSVNQSTLKMISQARNV